MKHEDRPIDPVLRPQHYNKHPAGIECINVIEWFNFNLGNAIKYIWRAGLKSEDPIADLQKAVNYLQFEITRLETYKPKHEPGQFWPFSKDETKKYFNDFERVKIWISESSGADWAYKSHSKGYQIRRNHPSRKDGTQPLKAFEVVKILIHFYGDDSEWGFYNYSGKDSAYAITNKHGDLTGAEVLDYMKGSEVIKAEAEGKPDKTTTWDG